MKKFLSRVLIFAFAAYYILCYAVADLFGIDLWSDAYVIALMLYIATVLSSFGNYHCKYAKWTWYGLTLAEIVAKTDYHFDYIPVNHIAVIICGIIAIGLSITATLSVRHFIKVQQWKKRRNHR